MKKIVCLILAVMLLPQTVLFADGEASYIADNSTTPVRDVILKGELLFDEDFDDSENIDADIAASIDGEMVKYENNALYINGSGKAEATSLFGVELKECIAEYDMKQLSCVGSSAANVTFGLNATAGGSYCFTYADVSKYNFETNTLNGSSAVRDRLLIGKTTGSNKMDKWSYFGATDSVSGALLTNGRKFERFYTFRAAIAGKTALLEMFDGDTLLDEISVKNNNIVPASGKQIIRMQNTEFLVDNIKVYDAKGIDSITFVPDKSVVKANESVGFKLILGDGTQLDKKFFDGVEITSDDCVAIDKENSTFTATEEGEFSVSVVAKDYSNPQLTVESNYSLNVISENDGEMSDSEAVEAARDEMDLDITIADSDFELPTAGPYDTTVSWESGSDGIRIDGNTAVVYKSNEQKEVTLTATIKKGSETAVKTFAVVVPALPAPDREVILKGELLFSEDFNNIENTDENLQASADGTAIMIKDNALYVNSSGKTLATAPFGAELKESIVQYDVKQLSCVGNSAAHITVGTNTVGQASYCFAYSDASKYNFETNALDGSTTIRDRLLIADSTGSNLMDKWTYFGVTDSASGALLTNGRKFERFYTFRAAIAGKTAVFEIFDGDALSDGISVTDNSIELNTGRQIIRSQNTEFLIDNIKVYEAKGIDSIAFVPDMATVKPGETVGFKLVTGDGTELDKKYFDNVEIFSDSSININKENCTFTANEEGAFTVNVVAEDYSDAEIAVESTYDLKVSINADKIENIANNLKIEDYISNYDSILEDFELPTEKDGASLSWQSDSEAIVINNNKASVTRGNAATVVNLTVTITTDGISTEKKFKVTVEKHLNDSEIIQRDVESVKIPERTKDDIVLPVKGRFGADISWSTNSANVISVNGKVNREAKDKTVTLTAVYTSGNEKKTVYYNVIVTGKASSGGSSSGGGSSGGSSGGGGSKQSGLSISNPVSPQNVVSKNEAPKNEAFKFSDINEGFWAADEIYSLVEKGVISKDTVFRPDDNIKREEFVKMSMEMFGLVNDNSQCNFVDCDENSWYYKYVASAHEAGIVSGTDEKTFGVGEFITREDMATIIARILGLKGLTISDSELVFSDKNEISAYARSSVAWLSSKGIIKGMGENVFAPENNATRAQCAVILYNAAMIN